ncbi:MAG: CRISPR-associated protein [Methanobacteriales archaeon HGW-Methanobacteriales-1]|jgi:CRISPR-associated protein Csh2|nr:MAG: CRISPR-associated protein [Methanobacteriales archaeon HGW-Methanobacteriales-1]
MSETVKNYYQGIYLTETIMGNPNGDFVDNSPRNFDGRVFTTDKCIKYNIRRYIHETVENIDQKENVVFFYPRQSEEVEKCDAKYLTKDTVFKNIFEENFDKLLENSPDVRMFGGTFSFKKDSKQIYGPIQLSYGKDINDAQIKRLQIGAPFADGKDGKQKTTGSEAVVDDAIISYDLTVNPNNYPGLLSQKDLNLFMESLWYGTNLRKTTSKKTDSKLLILIKIKNDKLEGNVKALNLGELKDLIQIENKMERKKLKNPEKVIKVDISALESKLSKYKEYIEKIDIYYDENDLKIQLTPEKFDNLIINYLEPTDLLKK